MAASTEPQIQRFAASTDPSLVWKTVEQDSVAIVSNVVPLDVIQRFNQEVEPQVEKWENALLGGWKFSPHTKFMNGLVSASQVYRHDILNNPVMHQMCEAAFERTGDYWVVSAVLRLTQPGHPSQPWHRDANGWPLVKSQQPGSPPLTVTIIIATTDFTEANGATRFFLGSHQWPAVEPSSEARPVMAELKAGDMLMMRQAVVHSGGQHTPEAPDTRSMLLLSFASCQLSQYESALTLPRSLVESLTPLVQKMVGWRTVFPLGHPMGLNTFRSGLVEEKLGLQANQPPKDETETSPDSKPVGISSSWSPESAMPFRSLRPTADRISQLVEAHDPSSNNAPETLLQLRRAASELEQQCVPSSDLELDFHYQPHKNACVRIAIELEIFDHLDDEPVRPTELAARIDTADPEFTLRIVRALCASGVLGEHQLSTGEVAVHHTPISKLWHRRPASQAYAKHQWDNMVLALSNLIPFLRTRGFRSPEDPSDSPFAYALGADNVDFFQLLQRYPERLASFSQGMTGTATSVVSIFPFASLANVHDAPVCLVDVGGGRGHTTHEILAACPELKGAAVVLQDLPTVLEHRDGLQVDLTQVQVQSYDFLRDEQPVRGAAAYLYKSICHDWPDASCHQILRNLAPAMRGFDSRLLICDLVVGQLASTHPHKALRDINMIVMAGRERTADEWEELLREDGFRMVHIWGVDNPGNSVIEARLII